MNNAKLYEEFNGKFCKVIIRTNSGEKSLKGNVTIFDSFIKVKGDYQNTTIHCSEVIRITTKQVDGDQNVNNLSK